MRYIVLLLACWVLAGSCKKQVEQVQMDALMNLITNGQWKVTYFKKGSTDITTQFSPYQFQFKRNETVDAIRSGTVEKTGTWRGNALEKTIQSSFGNVAEPLSLLNGMWLVSKTSLTHVEASQDVNGQKLSLRLDKL